VRLCLAYPGNPRIRIEGESLPLRKRDIRSEVLALLGEPRRMATNSMPATDLGFTRDRHY
jgi:hypothetical protein